MPHSHLWEEVPRKCYALSCGMCGIYGRATGWRERWPLISRSRRLSAPQSGQEETPVSTEVLRRELEVSGYPTTSRGPPRRFVG